MVSKTEFWANGMDWNSCEDSYSNIFLVLIILAVTTGNTVKELIQRTDRGSHVQQVDAGGTDGDESNVYPGTHLQTVHLRSGLLAADHLGDPRIIHEECVLESAEVSTNLNLRTRHHGVLLLVMLSNIDISGRWVSRVMIENSGDHVARVLKRSKCYLKT